MEKENGTNEARRVFDLSRVSLTDIENAKKTLESSGLVYHTPVISNVEYVLQLNDRKMKSLSLKLENMQNQGSFKIRGTLNQFLHLDKSQDQKQKLVTMSAGNYGKAFCYAAREFGVPATVFMPDNAPVARKDILEAMGALVTRCPTEELKNMICRHMSENNSKFLHPFDDPLLIIGHSSAGLEAIDDLIEPPDVVLVCCGGGGFLAGVTLAFQCRGLKETKIYGVEPENAPSMYLSFQAKKAVSIKQAPTVAAGLAPPFAGENSYMFIKDRVSEIILVSEDDIKRAVKALFTAGLVVETSGAAAIAALIANKVPDIEGKNVLAFITGGNATPMEICQLLSPT